MKQYFISTKYLDEFATLRFGKYGSGDTALQLVDPDTGETLSTASVNLYDYGKHPRDSRHIFVKSWSENEGMLDALIEAGIVGEPLRSVKAGFALAYECELLVTE